MTRPIQEEPGYHEGFADAQRLEPLFPDAEPSYAAGWRAFWECRELITEAPPCQRFAPR